MDNSAAPLGSPLAPRSARSWIRPFDIAIVVASAIALVALSLSVYGSPASATLIVTSGSSEWIYQLSESRTISVDGPLGKTVIQLADQSARIMDSPCPNKTCVASPAIGRVGEWSACLPNGVFMRIEGPEVNGEFDAIVR